MEVSSLPGKSRAPLVGIAVWRSLLPHLSGGPKSVWRQDGAMIVQLAQWGSAMGLEDALHAVGVDDFDPEAASAEAILVSRLLNWGGRSARLPRTGFSTRTWCSAGCG